MKIKKHAPVIAIPSDDFKIEVGEDVFYTHTKESVTFRRKITPRDLMAMAQVAEVQEKQQERPLEAAQALYEILCPLLSRRIVDWTWTDDDGKAYPKPAEVEDFTEIIRELALEEINYLVEKYNSASAPREAPKNSQSPSSEAS